MASTLSYIYSILPLSNGLKVEVSLARGCQLIFHFPESKSFIFGPKHQQGFTELDSIHLKISLKVLKFLNISNEKLELSPLRLPHFATRASIRKYFRFSKPLQSLDPQFSLSI